jgi:hypothetical protein
MPAVSLAFWASSSPFSMPETALAEMVWSTDFAVWFGRDMLEDDQWKG